MSLREITALLIIYVLSERRYYEKLNSKTKVTSKPNIELQRDTKQTHRKPDYFLKGRWGSNMLFQSPTLAQENLETKELLRNGRASSFKSKADKQVNPKFFHNLR